MSLPAMLITPLPRPWFCPQVLEVELLQKLQPFGNQWGMGRILQVPLPLAQCRHGTSHGRPTSCRGGSLGSLGGLHRWGPEALLSPWTKGSKTGALTHNHRGWDKAASARLAASAPTSLGN